MGARHKSATHSGGAHGRGVRRNHHQSLGALGCHLGYLGLGLVCNNLKKSPLIQSPGRQAGFGTRLASRTPNQLVVKYQENKESKAGGARHKSATRSGGAHGRGVRRSHHQCLGALGDQLVYLGVGG